MARRATFIKQARENGQPTLLLDAGNSLFNDEDPAKASRGAVSIELMNRMGYDAMTLGALDLTLLTVEELEQRIDAAEFPVLSANVVVAATGELLARPYVVLDVAGQQVAVVGLTDPLPSPVPADIEVEVTDPLEAARAVVPTAKKEADIVVLLSHAGVEMDERIATEVADIDVIVSGRNLTITEPLVVEPHGTLIVHADQARAGLAGEHVGMAELGFDKNGRLARHSWRKVALSADYVDDAEIAAFLAEWSESQ